MNDLIFVAIVVAAMIFGGFLSTFINKKLIIEKTSVVFVGWRKKNRAILRDERLIPFRWKTANWLIWIFIDITAMLTLVVPETIRENWTLVLIILAVGGAVLAGLIIAWRRSWATFYKLKDELGVVLDYNEDAIQKEIEKVKKFYKSYHPFYMFVYIFGAAVFTISSVVNFMQNRLFFGIFFASIAIYYIIMVIFYAKKKKRGVVNSDSES